METKIILRGRDVYKCLLEGKICVFKKGEPVVVHPALASVLKNRKDGSGKFLFETVHGQPIQEIKVKQDKSPEAIKKVHTQEAKKNKKTLGKSQVYGRRTKPKVDK